MNAIDSLLGTLPRGFGARASHRPPRRSRLGRAGRGGGGDRRYLGNEVLPRSRMAPNTGPGPGPTTSRSTGTWATTGEARLAERVSFGRRYGGRFSSRRQAGVPSDT